MNLLILYFILSWLPSLLRDAGMPVSAGHHCGRRLQHRRHHRHVAAGPAHEERSASTRRWLAEFVASLALVGLAALIFANFELMIVVTFILGISVQGAQAGMNVLAATYYPTAMRSTGVGWSLGVGRIGAIVGPLIGGAMLADAMDAAANLPGGRGSGVHRGGDRNSRAAGSRARRARTAGGATRPAGARARRRVR